WHADLDGTRARAAMAIVGAEAHPVNTPAAASHSFRAEIGVRRPDAPPIGATPVAPAVERLVLRDARHFHGDRVAVRIAHAHDRDVHETLIHRRENGRARAGAGA